MAFVFERRSLYAMDVSELDAIANQSTEFIVEHMEDMPLICLKDLTSDIDSGRPA